jgi:hypothetical protein
MSDRTPASVRTGSRGGDGAAPEAPRTEAPRTDGPRTEAPRKAASRADAPRNDAPRNEAPRPAGAPPVPPVSATQSIPASGAMRAQTAAPAAGAAQAPPRTVPPAPQVPAGPTRPAGAAGRPSGSAAKGKGRGKPAGRGPRRARLQLRHIDIWSAFKISLVLSIVLFFVWIIAVAILYVVLNSLGVFSTINDLFGQLGSATGQSQGGSQVVTPKVVFIGAAVIGAINVILMTALCTVATFIYNMCADLVGGLEVTLSERD